MKAYFIAVVFDGGYVTGFIVPQALNEKHALRQLRAVLWVRKKVLTDDKERKTVRSYLASLRRPWRESKKARQQGYRHKFPGKNQVVNIYELHLPLQVGYWPEELPAKNCIINNSETPYSVRRRVSA